MSHARIPGSRRKYRALLTYTQGYFDVYRALLTYLQGSFDIYTRLSFEGKYMYSLTTSLFRRTASFEHIHIYTLQCVACMYITQEPYPYVEEIGLQIIRTLNNHDSQNLNKFSRESP